MKLKLLVGIIAITLFACTPNPSAQQSAPLTNATPESVGMSTERLEHIDAMCIEHVDQGHLPGIVALVARKGKIVFHEAYGMADVEAGRSMKKDDIFRIASMSKAVTSTAMMMLWEEGKFQLDDPVSKYIPGFKNPQLLAEFSPSDTSYTTTPAAGEITIRHLLTHTSGIGYGMIDGDDRFRMIYQKAGVTDLFTTEDITIEESVKKLAPLPIHHNPGEHFTYSEGLDVSGYLVEIFSGMPFDKFLRERLFDPLGMDDTWFYLPESKADRLVPVQHQVEGEWEHYPVTFYDPEYPVKGAKQFFSGGAGLSSTAKDYATFLQMYLNGGELDGARILSRTTIRAIMGDQTGQAMENRNEYHGLAFGVVNEKGEDAGGLGSEGTFFWGGYFNTAYYADPKEQVIGIVMKQTQGSVDDQTGMKLRQLVGQAIVD
ncbi:MAG: serine hydrolase domain-containing protein [Bacteroidota bacterium]